VRSEERGVKGLNAEKQRNRGYAASPPCYVLCASCHARSLAENFVFLCVNNDLAGGDFNTKAQRITKI